jgi:UDP-N-acetyl-D-mannosaminuronate dehydrogenase
VHDPVVKAGEHEGLFVSNDLAAVLKGADAAVLLTEHKHYRSLTSKIFAENMRGRLIADGRNWLNHATLRSAGV